MNLGSLNSHFPQDFAYLLFLEDALMSEEFSTDRASEISESESGEF